MPCHAAGPHDLNVTLKLCVVLPDVCCCSTQNGALMAVRRWRPDSPQPSTQLHSVPQGCGQQSKGDKKKEKKVPLQTGKGSRCQKQTISNGLQCPRIVGFVTVLQLSIMSTS